jgi:hypothetical protein
LIAFREWGSLPALGTHVGPTEIARRVPVWAGQAKRTLSSYLPFLPFIVLSAAAFVVLARVFVLRLGYPLDLEWMEGGILTHALRLGRGQPIYAEPSVDFVSFLYTPLYPAVLCALSKIFGLSYVLGRAVSILAFSGALVFLVAAVRGIARQFESEELPALATTAGLLGAAAVCLAFPFCGAFYDLVRCDSLWLFFVSAGLYCCSPGRSMTRIVVGALLLVLGFFTKQTAAPFMVAAAASVALTSGITRGLVFSAVAFGSTTTAILVGQYLTDGWLWIYIYRLHQGHETLRERIWPETPRVLFDYGFVLLVPVAACLLLVAFRRRASRRLFYWASMAATGLATAAVGSGTEGAYDNAYIPAVYFAALLSAACAVELPALAAALRASTDGAVWSSGEGHGPWRGSLRMFGLLGLGLLSAHAVTRWLDPSPHVPSPQDHAEARRLLAYLTEQGPEILVPCHPFYSVLAGGRGHLHVMGVNDVFFWPRTITSDPDRDAAIKDRFRRSVVSSFESRRWKMVIQDDCPTPRLFGLSRYYRRVEDLARSGKAPRSLTGYLCAPRYVWLPRGDVKEGRSVPPPPAGSPGTPCAPGATPPRSPPRAAARGAARCPDPGRSPCPRPS